MAPSAKAALYKMQAPDVDPVMRAKLMEVFTMLDRNGSMQLDQREVGYLLNKLLGNNLDEMTLAEIMSEICDSDSPGVGIDFDMFVKAMAPVLSASPEELNQRAFQALDADGSGCIATAELAPLMSAVAGNMAESKVHEVLQLAAGPDGKMRYADFARQVTE